jgi:hypothetical protein
MARCPQIVANYSARSAGVQSLITLSNGEKTSPCAFASSRPYFRDCLLCSSAAVLGSCAKTYINYREANDPLLVYGSVATSWLNIVLLAQVTGLKSYELKQYKMSTDEKVVDSKSTNVYSKDRSKKEKIKKKKNKKE